MNTRMVIKTIQNEVKCSTYTDFNVKKSNKDAKIKVGDRIRISNYKNIFVKVILPIGLKNFWLLKKVKILCCGHI